MYNGNRLNDLVKFIVNQGFNTEEQMSGKIMLIDGNSIVNRAFYGVPLLSNSKGQYTNAIYGFFNILFKMTDDEKPEYIGVAFDLKAPTFRHKKFEDYKGTRKAMPEELASQMPVLKELLKLLNIKQYSLEGYEADDILGTLSKQAEEKGYETVVVSGDRDLLQLASESLKIKIPKTIKGKTEVEDYYAKDVVEKYGVTPTEFIEVKALMGDSSDNIPGVPSIGEKTAIKIIQQFKTVDEAIKNADAVKPAKASNNLKEYEEQARLSRFLVEIDRNAPVELDLNHMPILGGKISGEAYEYIKNLDFKSLLNRFTTEESTVEKITEESNSEYFYIDNAEDCEKFVYESFSKKSAYVIIEEDNKIEGISIFADGKGCFIESNENFTSEEIVKVLEKYFGDESIEKIGHNIKNDMKLLRPVELKGASFDTQIAAYILNSTEDTYNFDDIARDYLSLTIKSEEEVLGKGKKRVSIRTLDKNKRIDYAVKQAEVMFNAKDIMLEKIKENNQEKLFFEIEMPLINVLADMEKYGIKADRDGLIFYGSALSGQIDAMVEEIYALCGERFNINSPKQLGTVLFEKMGLKGGKKTKTGYSTSAEVLEKLKYDSPAIEKILLYRQLAKLKSTYADGLLNVLDNKTGRIYSTFNQTITATGRISSTEPNLQNIPVRIELGRELRKVFIPEDGYVFLDADYSQIELRVLAHMADDENLINAFKNGQDIHRLTASQVLNIPFDEVTPEQRRQAKAVNFGIIYGIGAFSLSQDLGITRKEAEIYIENYFAKYPNVKKYMDETIKKAKENGYVSTIFGRRRNMPELNSTNFNMRAFGERVAMNMPIQGTAADIIKIAMIKVNNALKENNLKSKLILQVHDELIIETLKEEKEKVSHILKENMENAVSLKVPMVADVKCAKNWYEAK